MCRFCRLKCLQAACLVPADKTQTHTHTQTHTAQLFGESDVYEPEKHLSTPMMSCVCWPGGVRVCVCPFVRIRLVGLSLNQRQRPKVFRYLEGVTCRWLSSRVETSLASILKDMREPNEREREAAATGSGEVHDGNKHMQSQCISAQRDVSAHPQTSLLLPSVAPNRSRMTANQRLLSAPPGGGEPARQPSLGQ